MIHYDKHAEPKSTRSRSTQKLSDQLYFNRQHWLRLPIQIRLQAPFLSQHILRNGYYNFACLCCC